MLENWQAKESAELYLQGRPSFSSSAVLVPRAHRHTGLPRSRAERNTSHRKKPLKQPENFRVIRGQLGRLGTTRRKVTRRAPGAPGADGARAAGCPRARPSPAAAPNGILHTEKNLSSNLKNPG